jgi:hypothetical protein
MDELTFPLLVAAAMSMAVLAFCGVRRWIRKRRQARIRWVGGRMGLHRAYHPGESLEDIWRERFLLLGGERKEVGDGVENLLQGHVEGRQVYLFDFEETIVHETNVWQSVLVIKSGGQGWPRFALHPRKSKNERFTRRLRTAVQEFASRGIAGYRRAGVRIEGYRLSCPSGSEHQVRDLFNAELIQYFSSHRQFALEGSNGFLLLYQRERLVTPGNLEAFVRDALSIHRLLLTAVNPDGGRQSSLSFRPGAGRVPSGHVL